MEPEPPLLRLQSPSRCGAGLDLSSSPLDPPGRPFASSSIDAPARASSPPCILSPPLTYSPDVSVCGPVGAKGQIQPARRQFTPLGLA